MKDAFFLFVICVFLINSNSLAWIYPEHRDIALLAIQNLSPEYRSLLDKLWAEVFILLDDH